MIPENITHADWIAAMQAAAIAEDWATVCQMVAALNDKLPYGRACPWCGVRVIGGLKVLKFTGLRDDRGDRILIQFTVHYKCRDDFGGDT